MYMVNAHETRFFFSPDFRLTNNELLIVVEALFQSNPLKTIKLNTHSSQ